MSSHFDLLPSAVYDAHRLALDESGWPWVKRISLLLDALIAREEAA